MAEDDDTSSDAPARGGADDGSDDSGGRLGWAIGLAGLGLVSLLVGLGWFAVPRVADSVLRDRLAAVEARTGLDADYERLKTSALEGTSLFDVRVASNQEVRPFLTIERVRTELDLVSLVSGDPAVSSLVVEGLELHVHRDETIAPRWRRLARRLAPGGGNGSGGSSDSTSRSKQRPGWMRYFGGEWPNVTVRNATIRLHATDGAPAWPVTALHSKRLEIVSSGETASVTGTSTVERGEGRPRWSMPDEIEVEGTLRLPIEDSTGRVSFDTPLEVVGVGPHPYLRAGIGGVRVPERHALEMRGLSLALQPGSTPSPLISLDRIRAQLARWPGSPSDADVDSMTLEGPELALRYSRTHDTNWGELRHLLRAPLAGRVVARARSLAERLADPDDDSNAGDAGTSGGGISSVALSALRRFINDASLPDMVRVRGARLQVEDHRELTVDRPVEQLGLREGRLTLEHGEMKGFVRLKGGFRARAEDGDRGAASGEITWTYRSGSFDWTAQLDALDLSWLAQMVGPRLAGRLRGGRLRAKIDSSPGDGRQTFSGFVSLEKGHVSIPKLAESSLESIDASYHFEGYYDPKAEMPEPELIRPRHLLPNETSASDRAARPTAPTRGDDEADAGPSSSEGSPGAGDVIPRRGAFVLKKGRAQWNGVEADVVPALYGLDGVRRLPSRLDLSVSLPKTEVQRLFESVPEAIRGPLNGTKMKGAFAWEFDSEFPLHNADETEWTTKPTLTNFELKNLPEPVDVRKLEKGFEHTIEIETDDFRVARTVDIPPMRPTPASWLVDNGEMTLKTIDERRRKREWPKRPKLEDLDPRRHVPDAYEKPDWVDAQTPTRKWMADFVDAPEVWLSSALEDQYAELPWSEEQPLASIDKLDVPDDRKPLPYVRELIARQQRGRPVRLDEPDDGWPEVHETEPSRGEEAETSSSGETASRGRNGRYLTRVDDSSARSSGTVPSGDSSEDATDSPFRPLDDSMIVTYGKEDRERHSVHPYGPYVYVPLHHVSKWMPRAILTTEDNSFFEHHGFNWFAVKDSLEDNIEAGGFVRGASTVSMQLIKNVFLSFDKVLARKLREVFLVWIMEDVVDLPKSRIMELYLNIIEFGPGIFGIHDAAVHYFGKRPNQLELGEVAWLTSIIPDPREYHRYYDGDGISDYWFEGMKHYVDVMHERGRVTPDDVERMKRERPTFYKPDEGEPKLRPESTSREASPSTMEDISDILD